MRAALVAALILLVLAPGFVSAEEGRAESALHSGATSLEIGVDTFGGTFSTAEIAARRHFSPSWAFRLAGSVGTDDIHDEEANLQDDVVYPGSEDLDQSSWALAGQALWFPVRKEDVALLLALGPKYARAHASRSTTDFGSNGSGVVRIEGQDESKSHSIGVAMDLGFEWFVGKRIALHARTGTAYSHSDGQQGYLRTVYDQGGAIVDRFGSARESKGNSFDTVEFGLRIVGYF